MDEIDQRVPVVQAQGSRAAASSDGQRLQALEQSLDSVLAKAIRAFWGRRRARRVHFAKPAGPLRDPSGRSDEELQISAAEAAAHALEVGAYESAIAFSESVVPSLAAQPDRVRARSVEVVLQTLLVSGDRARARDLAARWLGELRRSPTGVSLLEMLGLGEGAVYLPDGCPNFIGLSRRIERGDLDAEELARSIRGGKRFWLRYPELHLLFFMALRQREPLRALCWLNRFALAHGLPEFVLRDGSALVAQWFDALLGVAAVPAEAGTPLVSVIVPARDAGATLQYSLDSLLRQTHQSLEILVCDDASTDDTLEVMRRMRAMDPRIRLFRSKVPQGSYNLRNALAERARGRLLTFHDADDWASPVRIAVQVARLRETSAEACVCSMLRMTADGAFVFFRNQRATRLCMASLMLKPETFWRIGPFRPVRVGADLELYSRIVSARGARGVTRVRTPLMLVSSSSTSVTRSAGMEALQDGYRSPARRLYSELVHAQQTGRRLGNGNVEALLRTSGNYAARAAIEDY